MITLTSKGDFSKTIKSLNNMKSIKINNILSKYANEGVNALKSATPVDSGKTANSWSYSIESKKDSYIINWTNSNVNKGVNIAIILQYGHGTRNGGYVAGRDYINPALKPIFDKIANEAWAEVVKS